MTTNNPYQPSHPEGSRKPKVSQAALGGQDIDAMLDRIDLVLRGQPKHVGIKSLSFLPEAAQLNASAILGDLSAELSHLRELAEHAGDPELAGFAREFRARVEGFLAKRSSRQPASAAAIEVEMDIESLHEFMLDPDYSRVAG